MVKVALFVRLEAKPGKKRGREFSLGRPSARAGRASHYGVVRNRLGPSTFGILTPSRTR